MGAWPGMFVNVSFGTTLLNEACLPEVWDLTYAHALWDHMLRGASQRLPLLPAVKAYQVALLSRAPHMTDRLVEVRTRQNGCRVFGVSE